MVATILSSNPELCERIEAALRIPGIDAFTRVADFDAGLVLLGQAPRGDIVFLDFAKRPAAIKVASVAQISWPALTVVAVHTAFDATELRNLMRYGICEVLTEPFGRHEIVDIVRRAEQKINGRLEQSVGALYAFLPAKPGSGCTTVVTHTAAALARLTQSETLLLDFDLRLGVTSFLLKLTGAHSVVDALSFPVLDASTWGKLISRSGHLHVLGSAPTEFDRPTAELDFGPILGYAEQNYRAILVDLPGSMEPYETDTLRRARHTFMVCTPSIDGLHIARRKTATFKQLGIEDRVSAILNRTERGGLRLTDIERILGIPIGFTLPSDSDTIAKALQKGVPLAGKSDLARQIETIAKSIAAGLAPAQEEPKRVRRFIEYFSVSHARKEDQV